MKIKPEDVNRILDRIAPETIDVDQYETVAGPILEVVSASRSFNSFTERMYDTVSSSLYLEGVDGRRALRTALLVALVAGWEMGRTDNGKV